MQPSRLILQDNTVFEGFSPSWQKEDFYGEVVFATGMTGYCESLTDPSYAGQILVFTYPLIGNYGIPDASNWESDKIQVRGVIVGQACEKWSHYSGNQSLIEWLSKERIPLIQGVDTRQLTISLRSRGVMPGVISCTDSFTDDFSKDWELKNPIPEVSIKARRIHTTADAKKKIILVDCGMKHNIIRCLQQFPFEIHQVPYDTDFTSESFDGLFLSNGPGDPQNCHKTIATVQEAMRCEKPIYGICLGAQILALAAGAKTYKLPFGHRGHNHPCIHVQTKKCYITSQNHGYAIDEKSLSKEWEVSFKNLNDGSVEGISHRTLPFAAVQFHPEACPGPTDTRWFFDQFYQSVCHAEG